MGEAGTRRMTDWALGAERSWETGHKRPSWGHGLEKTGSESEEERVPGKAAKARCPEERPVSGSERESGGSRHQPWVTQEQSRETISATPRLPSPPCRAELRMGPQPPAPSLPWASSLSLTPTMPGQDNTGGAACGKDVPLPALGTSPL